LAADSEDFLALRASMTNSGKEEAPVNLEIFSRSLKSFSEEASRSEDLEGLKLK
jgi:hypothetical protein